MDGSFTNVAISSRIHQGSLFCFCGVDGRGLQGGVPSPVNLHSKKKKKKDCHPLCLFTRQYQNTITLNQTQSRWIFSLLIGLVSKLYSQTSAPQRGGPFKENTLLSFYLGIKTHMFLLHPFSLSHFNSVLLQLNMKGFLDDVRLPNKNPSLGCRVHVSQWQPIISAHPAVTRQQGS